MPLIPLKAPVVFQIFNRPHLTLRVFECIRKAQPHKLYIVSDGPRLDHSADFALVQQCRDIVKRIDWPCELVRIESDTNLGCLNRFFSSADIIFKKEDRAIFMEDDTLPHPTFFRFCDELLEYYKDEPKVHHIAGMNNLWSKFTFKESYFFTKYVLPWGWATWRRSWLQTPLFLSNFENATVQKILDEQYDSDFEKKHWTRIFKLLHDDPYAIQSYDYRSLYALFINGGLAVNPSVNLVTNIGFGPEATHTKVLNPSHIIPVHAMKFPLIHPTEIVRDPIVDNWIFRVHSLSYEARPGYRHLDQFRIWQGAMRRRFWNALKSLFV
jgi:hypothetical protein